MRDENHKLQASMRQFIGEDLASMTLNEVNQLEEQLEFSVNKVRARKVALTDNVSSIAVGIRSRIDSFICN